jgi:hypothetical protein
MQAEFLAGSADPVRQRLRPAPGRVRAVCASLLVSVVLPAIAAESDSLVPDLEQRLARGGVEQVNAHLDSHWSSAMTPLNQKTARCELHAVSLAIRLSRSTDARAAQAHNDAIREAVGVCTGFVLALALPQEIPKYCSSVASWSVGHTARELRRRIAAIDSDETLRSSQNGASCRAAYFHELHHTRVVLKRMRRSGHAEDQAP